MRAEFSAVIILTKAELWQGVEAGPSIEGGSRPHNDQGSGSLSERVFLLHVQEAALPRHVATRGPFARRSGDDWTPIDSFVVCGMPQALLANLFFLGLHGTRFGFFELSAFTQRPLTLGWSFTRSRVAARPSGVLGPVDKPPCHLQRVRPITGRMAQGSPFFLLRAPQRTSASARACIQGKP